MEKKSEIAARRTSRDLSLSSPERLSTPLNAPCPQAPTLKRQRAHRNKLRPIVKRMATLHNLASALEEEARDLTLQISLLESTKEPLSPMSKVNFPVCHSATDPTSWRRSGPKHPFDSGKPMSLCTGDELEQARQDKSTPSTTSKKYTSTPQNGGSMATTAILSYSSTTTAEQSSD